MALDDVVTFLAVVEHGTISKAAEVLYIGQGTASKRIRALEHDLGAQLFSRQKGLRAVTLTPEGETFLPIAQQLSALWADATRLRDLRAARELRISAPDLLNTFVLGEAYRRFTDTNPTIYLTVQTEHSTETHQMIENQLTDLGFAFTLHTRFHNVLATPLYTEEMVVVYHQAARFARTGDPADLRPEDEVYSRWSQEFNTWHTQHYPSAGRRRITVGTVSMLPLFLAEAESWGIVTRSVARMLHQRIPDLRTSDIPQPPPRRTAYLLENRYPKPWISEVKDTFLREVFHELRTDPTLTLIDPTQAGDQRRPQASLP